MHQLMKTLFCVAIAGLLFLAAILFNMPILVIVGAFFDWLPLPTKWMIVPEESGISVNKSMVRVHLVFTLVAYAFAILWVLMAFVPSVIPFPEDIVKTLFIEIWWLAVIVGQTIYLPHD